MSEQRYSIRGTVISVFNIEDFEGAVIPVFAEPNFVIALRLDDSKHSVHPGGSDVEVTAFDVIFYALPSVSALFGRSDVVGTSFTLDATIETIDGQEWHFLTLG